MQTFLPFPSYTDTAKVLDFKRLGKQRVEAKMLLEILLEDKHPRWKNHPAVAAWKGFEYSLAQYGYIMCLEWKFQGYEDNLRQTFARYMLQTEIKRYMSRKRFSQDFHARHRAALLAKNLTWYCRFGWTEIPKVDYVWE